MRTVVIAIATAVVLSGCANSSPNTLQFSGASTAFPSDYKAMAAKAIIAREAIAPGLQVSYPMPILGETPFSPKRWYVCVLGVATTKTLSTKLPDLTQLAGSALHGARASGEFDLIMFLHPGQTPGVLEAFDAELCRGLAYEPLPVSG